MKIVIYKLLIAMPEIRENIGMKNHHPFHKTNASISNEEKNVQGEDLIFYSASIVFYSFTYNTLSIYAAKPISILQELQESLGVGVGIKMKIPYHGKLLG